MRKVIICMAALATGTLFSSTLLAADSNNLTTNIVYKIGSKTYNGTTSGVLNVTPEPSPGPAPTPGPTYQTSITFNYGGIPTVTAEQLAEKLNLKSAEAHAIFSGDDTANTWTMTCDSGYIVNDPEIDAPAWGTQASVSSRVISFVQYQVSDNSYVSTQSGSYSVFQNGTKSSRYQIMAGCVQVPAP